MKTFLPRIRQFIFISAAFVALSLHSTDVLAQDENKKVVTLKTSEKLTGTIVEAVPDQYIKLQMEDNSIRKISADDISNIDDLPAVRAANRKKQRADARVGYSFIGSVFGGVDVVSGLNYVIAQPSFIAAVRVKTHHIGLGLGVIYGHTLDPNNPNFGPYDNSTSSPTSLPDLIYMPIFLNYHGDIGKKKVYFSVDASIGYPINVQKCFVYREYYDQTLSIDHKETIKQTGQLYADFGPGVSFRLSRSILLNVSAVFHIMLFNEINQDVQNDVGYTAYYNPAINSNDRFLGTIGGSIKIIY